MPLLPPRKPQATERSQRNFQMRLPYASRPTDFPWQDFRVLTGSLRLNRKPLLLARWLRLLLCGGSVGQGVDHFAGLGVVELFARLMLNGVGIGLEPVNLLAQ